MKTNKLKGAIITDDLRGIIHLLMVGFVIWFLFYITGVDINTIINLVKGLLLDIIAGFGDILVAIISAIFSAIVSTITGIFSFVFNLFP